MVNIFGNICSLLNQYLEDASINYQDFNTSVTSTLRRRSLDYRRAGTVLVTSQRLAQQQTNLRLGVFESLKTIVALETR
jgi:hypothetical protein